MIGIFYKKWKREKKKKQRLKDKRRDYRGMAAASRTVQSAARCELLSDYIRWEEIAMHAVTSSFS